MRSLSTALLCCALFISSVLGFVKLDRRGGPLPHDKELVIINQLESKFFGGHLVGAPRLKYDKDVATSLIHFGAPETRFNLQFTNSRESKDGGKSVMIFVIGPGPSYVAQIPNTPVSYMPNSDDLFQKLFTWQVLGDDAPSPEQRPDRKEEAGPSLTDFQDELCSFDVVSTILIVGWDLQKSQRLTNTLVKIAGSLKEKFSVDPVILSTKSSTARNAAKFARYLLRQYYQGDDLIYTLFLGGNLVFNTTELEPSFGNLMRPGLVYNDQLSYLPGYGPSVKQKLVPNI